MHSPKVSRYTQGWDNETKVKPQLAENRGSLGNTRQWGILWKVCVSTVISGHTRHHRLMPYKTSSSPANYNSSGSSHTRQLHSGNTRYLCLQPDETHLGLSAVYSTLSPLASLHGGRKTNTKLTHDAFSSLFKILCGKWAGSEYYHNLTMAIHMNKEIYIRTTSNWPPIYIQLP